MADDAQTRKLATIVALDVAGYSACTEADEAKTTSEVAALRGVIEIPIFLFGLAGNALRGDARFPRLCARLGLVDYWMTSGHWPDCANEVLYDFKAECENAAREVARA